MDTASLFQYYLQYYMYIWEHYLSHSVHGYPYSSSHWLLLCSAGETTPVVLFYFEVAVDAIGHVNEYPTMHYFGNPRHTESITV